MMQYMQSMVHIIQGQVFHVKTYLKNSKLDDLAICRTNIQFTINNKYALQNAFCTICGTYDS